MNGFFPKYSFALIFYELHELRHSIWKRKVAEKLDFAGTSMLLYVFFECSALRLLVEEGWVVCRAFRKPSPNQRQGFEAWNHAYYIRDNSHVRAPMSISDIGSTFHHLHPNQGSSFHDQSYGSEQELVSNHNVLDSQQVIELPQLDSPTTVSPSLAAKEGFQRNFVTNYEDCEEEKSNNSSQYIDWKNLDNFLASQLTDTTSYPYQTAPLIPQNYEVEAQEHLLGCFPGS
ncbi:NAC domain-containing protein 30 [Herrania umbratica]|uniref:NAC domain-containing protein 30 n=1 Tax=Herrania umbratica TaxID=108875 RepID=A0A6J1AP97_9ROSI|nr:NAC domain-containing protein 30 [Herrania umbratica]